jgi:hypothetical protein
MQSTKTIKKSQDKNNEIIIDRLTEDPVLSEQKFVCVSFLKPSQLEEKYRPKDISVCGFKVRGSFDSYEEAQKRCEFLRKVDDKHNIYIAEVGKWCPFEDNPEKAKDSEYMNKDLNTLMKNYWKQQSDAKEFHEVRKQEMVNKALEDVEKRKKENKKLEDEDEQEQGQEQEQEQEQDQGQGLEQLNKTQKSKKTKKIDKGVKLEEMKNNLTENKQDLEHEKKEIDNNINTLRKLEEELAQKIKELEAEGAVNPILNKINL